MADKATMADLGAVKEQRKNYRDDTTRGVKRLRPAIRDDKERGSVTDRDAEHVHEECPSCTCKPVGKIRQGDEKEGTQNKGAEKRAAGTADQRGGVYKR